MREDLLARLEEVPESDLEVFLEAVFSEPEESGLDEDLAIASLAGDERFAMLERRILRNKANWAQRFGEGALSSNNIVDQREVDYKRGYFGGALFYVRVLPKRLAKRAAAAAQTDEGE